VNFLKDPIRSGLVINKKSIQKTENSSEFSLTVLEVRKRRRRRNKARINAYVQIYKGLIYLFF
jgi:hypothetical protein